MENKSTSQKKEFTGVWIPKHIIEDLELSATDKIVYAEIACFEVCYKSNKAIGERYNLQPNTISIIVSKLIQKGYINSNKATGDYRQLLANRNDPSLITIKEALSKKSKRGGGASLKIIKEPLLKKSKRLFENNHTIDNIIDNKENTQDTSYPGGLRPQESSIVCDHPKGVHQQEAPPVGNPLPADGVFSPAEITAKKTPDPVNQLLDVFYEKNRGLNYANKKFRTDAEWLIKEYGLEGAINGARMAISVQGEQYAPFVSDPTQLRARSTNLVAFFQRKQSADAEKEKKSPIDLRDLINKT